MWRVTEIDLAITSYGQALSWQIHIKRIFRAQLRAKQRRSSNKKKFSDFSCVYSLPIHHITSQCGVLCHLIMIGVKWILRFIPFNIGNYEFAGPIDFENDQLL